MRARRPVRGMKSTFPRGLMNAIAQSVSAETACEILHKALPRKRRGVCRTPYVRVGALFAAIEDVRPKRGAFG